MPFINGRFYMNPAYGRAIERARRAGGIWSEELPEFARAPLQEQNFSNEVSSSDGQQQSSGEHWVTIDGRRVLIDQASPQKGSSDSAPHPKKKSPLSARDKSYLDKYYDAVSVLAKKYDVYPALVLEVGIESGFASKGTYLRTGDAFGMTGGSTRHMTNATSPSANVKQFFDNYGKQIRGTGSDASAFINALQGRDASGEAEKGWKEYNSVNSGWEDLINSGINEMRKAVPIYLQETKAKKDAR
ncbi:MAG: hypothetical protein WCD43_15255 [Candidatus Acidiferrales bacterium]